MSEITVTIMRYNDRKNYILVYIDPISGKRKTKSARTTSESEAWKAAVVWQEELRNGDHCPPSKVTWASFRERYEKEHLATLRKSTQSIARFALNRLEQHLSPDLLCKINASALSQLQAKLREERKVKRRTVDRKTEVVTLPPVKDTSIATILRTLKAAFAWATSIGMMTGVPKVNMPKRSRGKKMKGGALVGEQFDRMLAAVPKVRPNDAPAWQRHLTGLWLSGLRLSESMALSWDAGAPFAIDLSGKYPLFRIDGDAQKSGDDERTPMTPDFAEFILQTPQSERRGKVFRLFQDNGTLPLDPQRVGQTVSMIGAAAGIVVNAKTGKTASAHDLRRSFGTRWARKAMPALLRKLMRHANIQTTMQYYVDLDADEVADELWAKHSRLTENASNINGNSSCETVNFCR